MKLSSGSPMSSKTRSSLPVASSWTRRHANAAGLGQAFKAGDDVDAVADDVAVLGDDVAHMDDDTELDPPIRRQRAIAFSQGRLHFGRAAKRFDDAAELDEQPVAGSLDDAAAVLGDFGSRSSRRSVRRRCRVPPSSAPISRE